jgi:16S rRNA pseudouridine516 synthase
MRLDKLLSNLGYGSRTDIKKLCKGQQVLVNGEYIKQADLHIDPEKDVIKVFGNEVFYRENITLIINKPQGYICSNHDEAYPSLLRLLDEKYQRLPFNFAGRLDYDTEGLVIITTDGNLIHRIISPKKEVYKKYYVKVKNKLINEKRLEAPLTLLDGKNETYITKDAKVEKIDDYSLYLSICEGKFHQVKRMLEAINNEVIYLKRVSIGKLELPSDLTLGSAIEIHNIEDIFL